MVCLPRALSFFVLIFIYSKNAPFYINNEAINAIVLGCHLPTESAIKRRRQVRWTFVASGQIRFWDLGYTYLYGHSGPRFRTKRARNSKALQPKERTAIFITMFSQIAAPPPPQPVRATTLVGDIVGGARGRQSEKVINHFLIIASYV